MKTRLMSLSIVFAFAFAAPALAEGKSGDKGAAPAKPQPSEVRALLNNLQGQADKLHELMEQYRSLLERRPPGKAKSEELDKWNAAFERQLLRIDATHATVAENLQRLDQLAKGDLPTSLAKDVANTHNQADAARLESEQILAKNKAALAKAKAEKPAKPAEKAPPPSEDELDL